MSRMERTQVRVDRRPLLDTAVDADLFVDREQELSRLLRAVELGLSACVTGAPGAGTTSLLRHLAWRLRAAGTEPVQLSAADLTDAAEVLLRLLRRLAGDEAAAVARVAGLDAPALIERIGREIPERLVVLLDDASAEVGRALFGALRDEVWRLEATWIVGAPATEAPALLRPPVDAFFELVVDVGPLPPVDAAQLLRRRGTALPDGDLATLVRLADGNPRRLVDLARAVLVEGLSPADLAARRQRREARLRAVSATAAELLGVLDAVGAAGPSDPAVQARMGVSRPRLVTLFGELRDAGLVTESVAARNQGGPGRPRIRYAPAEVGADDDVVPGHRKTVGGVGDSSRDDD